MPTGALTPELQTFLDCWKTACGAGAVPARAAIRPDVFPRQSLGYMTYQEYEAPGKLIWKIAGTALVDRIGMELAGRNALELVPSEGRDYDISIIEMALARPCGLIYVMAFRSRYGNPILYRFLQLPVRGDEGAVNRFVGLVEPYILDADTPEINMENHQVRRYGGGLVDIGFGIPDLNTVLSDWNKINIKP